MPAYVIARLDVQDAEWRRDYAQKTRDLIHKHGGRELARFGSKMEVLEPRPDTIQADVDPATDPGTPDAIVILEFPSGDHARNWYHDPAYAPLIVLRQTGSVGDLMLIDPDGT